MISLDDPVLDIDDVLFLKPVTMPVPELLTDDVLIRGGTFRPEPALLIEEALSLTIKKVSAIKIAIFLLFQLFDY